MGLDEAEGAPESDRCPSEGPLARDKLLISSCLQKSMLALVELVLSSCGRDWASGVAEQLEADDDEARLPLPVAAAAAL